MRDSPDASTIWRPFTIPSLQPNPARIQTRPAVITRAYGERKTATKAMPRMRPRIIPDVEMMAAAKISPGGLLRKRRIARARPLSRIRPMMPPMT